MTKCCFFKLNKQQSNCNLAISPFQTLHFQAKDNINQLIDFQSLLGNNRMTQTSIWFIICIPLTTRAIRPPCVKSFFIAVSCMQNFNFTSFKINFCVAFGTSIMCAKHTENVEFLNQNQNKIHTCHNDAQIMFLFSQLWHCKNKKMYHKHLHHNVGSYWKISSTNNQYIHTIINQNLHFYGIWCFCLLDVPEIIYSMNVCCPLHVALHCVISNQKGMFPWVRPLVVSLIWFVKLVPFLNFDLRQISAKWHALI